MRVLGISGSLRRDSHNTKLLRAAGELVEAQAGAEFTLYDGDDKNCRGTTYKAGQSFVDSGFGHVHIGRNEGASNVEFYAVYLAPAPAGQPLRIDAPSSGNCSF